MNALWRFGTAAATIPSSPDGRRRRQRGASALETLIAMPMLLLVGLGGLQWALVFHAHRSLAWALDEAARAASVANADPDAALAGLASGLAPWLYGAQSEQPLAMLRARALIHVEAARAAGWLRIEQRAPDGASFDDWAEPALDETGHPKPELLEIPNDNLATRGRVQAPATGGTARRGEAMIGAASGQTLADANLLKLEMTYGIPLVVPLVGRLASLAMRAIDGCDAPRTAKLGVSELRISGTIVGEPWRCPFYQGVDERGREMSRWPIRIASIMRMQSPARRSAWTPDASGAAMGAGGGGASDAAAGGVQGGGSLGAGNVSGFGATASASAAAESPGSGATDRPAGYLQFGGPTTRVPAGICSQPGP